MAVTSKSNRREVEMQLDAKIKAAIEGIADEVLRDVQESYRAPKHGRLYGITRKKLGALRRFRAGKRKTAPRGLHRASKAGEAPAVDSAALSKGTTRTPAQKVSHLRWVVSLGVTLQSGRATPGADGMSIAERLEKGSTGGRLAPRPAWSPALAAMRARRLNLKK